MIWTARYPDSQKGRQHVQADLRVNSTEKWVWEGGKSGRESVNKRWSWLTSMTRWRSSSLRDWSRGARAPQLPPQDVSKEGPRHVCLGCCLLLITIALSSFFPPSPSISYYISVFSICPKSWNNVISFQREAKKLQQPDNKTIYIVYPLKVMYTLSIKHVWSSSVQFIYWSSLLDVVVQTVRCV